MVSSVKYPVTAERLRDSQANSRHRADENKMAPPFKRMAPAALFPAPGNNDVSKAKDKGSIAPGASTYDEIISSAQAGLDFWNNGMQWNSSIRVAPNPRLMNVVPVLGVFMEGMNGGIHATVSNQGNPLHQLQFMPVASGRPQVIFNGQMLTPMSSADDLMIAALVGREISNA